MRAVVHRHMSLVWRVLRRSGLPSADADEVAQDVFWVFAQRAAEVPEYAERSFLVSVALRVASDRRRSKWNRRSTEPLEPESYPSHELLPDEALARDRNRALLDEALESLDTPHREVFVLFEIEQMTREEVAEVLGIPPGTVASRLRKAREEFRAAAERLQSRTRRHG
ncbi:MAG: sigma-70 family RNA polymerase sigma factor [Polyangiaceae bacterium]